VWVQEEPKNQGAWTFVAPRIEATLAHMGRPAALPYIGRPEYASTAAGLMSQHATELHAFLDEALSL
jgi:2-oxoglutarate dehydrogenase E1 component